MGVGSDRKAVQRLSTTAEKSSCSEGGAVQRLSATAEKSLESFCCHEGDAVQRLSATAEKKQGKKKRTQKDAADVRKKLSEEYSASRWSGSSFCRKPRFGG